MMNEEFCSQACRKTLRIIFTDPDATDASSNEDLNKFCKPCARLTKNPCKRHAQHDREDEIIYESGFPTSKIISTDPDAAGSSSEEDLRNFHTQSASLTKNLSKRYRKRHVQVIDLQVARSSPSSLDREDEMIYDIGSRKIQCGFRAESNEPFQCGPYWKEKNRTTTEENVKAAKKMAEVKEVEKIDAPQMRTAAKTKGKMQAGMKWVKEKDTSKMKTDSSSDSRSARLEVSCRRDAQVIESEGEIGDGSGLPTRELRCGFTCASLPGTVNDQGRKPSQIKRRLRKLADVMKATTTKRMKIEAKESEKEETHKLKTTTKRNVKAVKIEAREAEGNEVPERMTTTKRIVKALRKTIETEGIERKKAPKATKNKAPNAPNVREKVSTEEGKTHKYIGVRKKRWRKYGAEIRDPSKGRRVWLGTFDTEEEAAHAYDEAAWRIRGLQARTNFPARPSADDDDDDAGVPSTSSEFDLSTDSEAADDDASSDILLMEDTEISLIEDSEAADDDASSDILLMDDTEISLIEDSEAADDDASSDILLMEDTEISLIEDTEESNTREDSGFWVRSPSSFLENNLGCLSTERGHSRCSMRLKPADATDEMGSAYLDSPLLSTYGSAACKLQQVSESDSFLLQDQGDKLVRTSEIREDPANFIPSSYPLLLGKDTIESHGKDTFPLCDTKDPNDIEFKLNLNQEDMI